MINETPVGAPFWVHVFFFEIICAPVLDKALLYCANRYVASEVVFNHEFYHSLELFVLLV